MVDRQIILRDLQLEAYMNIILGSPLEEFDRFVDDWYKLGGEEITSEVNAWFRTNGGGITVSWHLRINSQTFSRFGSQEVKGLFRIPAQSWLNSIFARLIMTYLAFVIPLILLGVYLYHWSYDTASQEISLSTDRRLNQFAMELNREIEWMELQQFDIAEDRKLNRLAILWNMMDQVERRETLNYLSERLAAFKTAVLTSGTFTYISLQSTRVYRPCRALMTLIRNPLATLAQPEKKKGFALL